MRPVLILLLSVTAVAVGTWMELERFKATPLELPGESLVLDVPRGTSLRGLGEDMTARGLLDNPFLLVLLAHARGDAARIKAGEYRLQAGMTPVQLLDLLTAGKVVQRAVTLVEGWTVAEALAAVAADERVESTSAGATPEALMAALGQEDLHPEGLFFPDTYYFAKGASDLDIMRRARERMESVLAQEWEGRAKDLPLERPYEALILASVVEKETGLPSERAAIAGVFVRRLVKGMKLQTDPTVIYGLGASFDGNLRRADLRSDTPYNTYVHRGLPPTPIALPGRAAIRAALNPEDGESLYIVAKCDGSHVFSATLAEHNRAVRRYQLGKGPDRSANDAGPTPD
jgi:UPF0755 protein